MHRLDGPLGLYTDLTSVLPFSTDPRSSQSSSGAQSFFGDLENEADIEDGECAHVPGLKKKKWI